MEKTERKTKTAFYLTDCGTAMPADIPFDDLTEERSEWFLFYLSSGGCCLVSDGDECAAEEGSVILLPPDKKCAIKPEGESVIYRVAFGGKEVARILSDLSLLENSVLFMGKSKEFEETFAALRVEHRLERRDAHYATVALLLRFLVVISRKYTLIKGVNAKDEASVIYPILDRIPLRLQEPLTVELLAAESGYSVGRFSHLFKETVGQSPHMYLVERRLEKAKDLLIHTHYTIAAVGRAVGFADQNYFSRFFKKQTGVSPTAYRACGTTVK